MPHSSCADAAAHRAAEPLVARLDVDVQGLAATCHPGLGQGSCRQGGSGRRALERIATHGKRPAPATEWTQKGLPLHLDRQAAEACGQQSRSAGHPSDRECTVCLGSRIHKCCAVESLCSPDRLLLFSHTIAPELGCHSCSATWGLSAGRKRVACATRRLTRSVLQQFRQTCGVQHSTSGMGPVNKLSLQCRWPGRQGCVKSAAAWVQLGIASCNAVDALQTSMCLGAGAPARLSCRVRRPLGSGDQCWGRVPLRELACSTVGQLEQGHLSQLCPGSHKQPHAVQQQALSTRHSYFARSATVAAALQAAPCVAARCRSAPGP